MAHSYHNKKQFPFISGPRTILIFVISKNNSHLQMEEIDGGEKTNPTSCRTIPVCTGHLPLPHTLGIPDLSHSVQEICQLYRRRISSYLRIHICYSWRLPCIFGHVLELPGFWFLIFSKFSHTPEHVEKLEHLEEVWIDSTPNCPVWGVFFK